jgi:hypothetical protein
VKAIATIKPIEQVTRQMGQSGEILLLLKQQNGQVWQGFDEGPLLTDLERTLPRWFLLMEMR